MNAIIRETFSENQIIEETFFRKMKNHGRLSQGSKLIEFCLAQKPGDENLFAESYF